MFGVFFFPLISGHPTWGQSMWGWVSFIHTGVNKAPEFRYWYMMLKLYMREVYVSETLLS